MTVATRTEVGTAKMGNVFIFARTSPSGDTWMVRAGNHTLGTYATEAEAENVARAVCGDQNLGNDFVATGPSQGGAEAPKAAKK